MPSIITFILHAPELQKSWHYHHHDRPVEGKEEISLGYDVVEFPLDGISFQLFAPYPTSNCATVCCSECLIDLDPPDEDGENEIYPGQALNLWDMKWL